MGEVLLDVRHLSCSFSKEKQIFHDVELQVFTGDVLVLQGKSGCGKSTLLKCLAHLNIYDGEVLYRGKSPVEHGVPLFRTCVLYVPQRPSLLPGTPRDFLKRISTFAVWQTRMKGCKGKDFQARTVEVAEEWGVGEELWNRKWTELSGGEAQRVAMAAAVGLNMAEILLLDEPTSALDSESASSVEKYLTRAVNAPDSSLKAVVWITHSPEQGKRVGTRFVSIVDGVCHEDHLRESEE